MSNFFTQRFYLDTPSDRSRGRGGENYVGPFKSFWVSDTNSTSFSADLLINPIGSSDNRGIPLRLNQCQSFENRPDGACLEFSIAQPGVWIEITFSLNETIQVGSVAVNLSGVVSINEGELNPQSKVTVTSAISEILDNDEDRLNAKFQYKSGTGIVYVGSNTELSDPDFANICHEVQPGDDFEIPGGGSHSAKCVGGTNIYSLRKGKKV